ncbi:MAG: hypothetical protein ACFFA6_09685 [Promethearchaeota archaeon]
MMSSNIGKSEPVLKINNLFYEVEIDNKKIEFLEQTSDNPIDDNLVILEEIGEILKNCTILTENQKLDYCKSQRYFMKLYLKEVNRDLNRKTG